MREKQQFRWRIVGAFAAVLGLVAIEGCHSPMEGKPNHPSRDINAVLADHDRQLLAIPGVVGVYIGLLNDEKTPCLKVMLARPNRELKQSIPRTIEGYRVVTEVTGEIKPLGPDKRSE